MAKIKFLILSLALTLSAVLGLGAQAIAQNCANPATAEEAIQCGANQVGGQQSANPQRIEGTIENVINILSVLIGLVAVVMVMVAGFRYITSGGDATRTKGAKDTLLYAIIGLIIVALAQVIVRFVLNTATSTSQGECQRTRNGAFWIGGPNNGKPC